MKHSTERRWLPVVQVWMLAFLIGLVLAPKCCAQLPPPPLGSGFGQPCGAFTNVQVGYSWCGTQHIFAYCDLIWIRPGPPGQPPGIGIGGTVYFAGSSSQPNCGPPFWYPSGTALSAFAIAPAATGQATMPGAAVFHDQVWLSPAFQIFLPVYQEVGSYDTWIWPLAVPPNPVFIGTAWECQTFRIDPQNNLFYLSNEVTVVVYP